jgi:ribosomal protein L11 methyltransferase
MSQRETIVSEYLPYKDLYIYLIEGHISEKNEAVLGDAFLGNWVEENTAFLFFSEPAKDVVKAFLKQRAGLTYIDDYQMSYEQWQGGILEPIRIEHFLITPPWVEEEPKPGDIKIIIDPGVVFGTGLHATTKDCLKAMVTLQEERIPMENILDLGTGTGILALAAGFLGAGKVTAVDLNPLAVKTTKRNVILNNLEGIINVFQGPAQDFVNQPTDLVIANIHHQVIQDLVETDGFRKKRRFIISGLMRSQVRDVKVQTQKYGLELVREWDHEMTWYTLLLVRT